MNMDLKDNRAVLIVDDEELVKNLGKRVLEKIGLKVHVSSDSLRATQLLREHKDETVLAILDVIMPDMEGTELGYLLREIKSDLKILFSSGYGANPKVQQFISSGQASFIDKPYTREDMIAKVQEMIES